MFADQEPIEVVVIDGGVLLKIVNHCQASLPATVTGKLLGLDVNKRLEVTATFPSPTEDDANEDVDREYDEYLYTMMTCLRDVNVDANSIGWYCSSLDEIQQGMAIETQFSFQKELGRNSAFIVYDPLKTSQGKLWLKAYRLREDFMQLFEHQDFMAETLRAAGVAYTDILEEIPIEISNNILTQMFLKELKGSANQIVSSDTTTPENCFSERKDLEASDYLGKGLEGVLETVDTIVNSHAAYSYNYKKYMQAKTYKEDHHKAQKPSRLESMLHTKALIDTCGYLDETASKNFENLSFSQAIQTSEST